MLISYFRVCKLWVLPLKTDIWWNVKEHINWSLCRLNPKICHSITQFSIIVNCYRNLFSWPSAILCWCWQAYHLPKVTRTAWYCQVCHFLNLKISLNKYIFNCLSIAQKHFAQTCGSINVADSQTFHQMSNVNTDDISTLTKYLSTST